MKRLIPFSKVTSSKLGLFLVLARALAGIGIGFVGIGLFFIAAMLFVGHISAIVGIWLVLAGLALVFVAGLAVTLIAIEENQTILIGKQSPNA